MTNASTISDNGIQKLKVNDIADQLELAWAVGWAAMLWGLPGIGKSAGVKEFARKIGATLVDIRLSMYSSVDLRGLPDLDNDAPVTVWRMASTIPFQGNPLFAEEEKNGTPIVLFLDELLHAVSTVQAVSFQLLHPDDRGVGEFKLIDSVIVIAASNMKTHRSGAGEMYSAQANRLMHYEVLSDMQSFQRYAAERELSPFIGAFLNFRPEHLNAGETAIKANAKAFPTERVWEGVSGVLATAKSPVVRKRGLASLLGTGVASEFEAFLEVYETLPKLDTIIDDPEGAPVPDIIRRDVLCATANMVARKITNTNADPLVTYLRRLPAEYQVMAMVQISHSPKTAGLVITSDAVGDLNTDLADQLF